MREEVKDLVSGLLGLVFGVWLLWETYRLDVEMAHNVGGGMSAAGYPKLLGLFIVGLSLLLSGRYLVLIFTTKKRVEGEESQKDRTAFKKVGCAFLGLIIYTLMLTRVGYLIMTAPLLGMIMYLFGERRWFFISITSIIVTGTLYAVTYYVFHIAMPQGILGF
jgi:hypothetical protein